MPFTDINKLEVKHGLFRNIDSKKRDFHDFLDDAMSNLVKNDKKKNM